MKLYQPIKIPAFENKHHELVNLVKDKFQDPNIYSAYDPPRFEMETKCPDLYSYIIEKSKLPIRFFRIYNTPPHGVLGHHIDGTVNFRSPIGLNIPIQNCKNTLMKWWDESNAKILNSNFGYANIAACKIENTDDLVCIDQFEITGPTFVRTDYIHSVENYNDASRIMLSIRWEYGKTKGQDFDQVLDFEPL